MWTAAEYLCKNIPGCKTAYVQSDEISLLITDWDNEKTQGWYDYDLEKLCSVTASMATSSFLMKMLKLFPSRKDSLFNQEGLPGFDARFWNLPKEEVNNYFIWRQQDARRNSVSMLARSKFSHKECQNKSCIELKEMLKGVGIIWKEVPYSYQHGICLEKNTFKSEVTFLRDGVLNTTEVIRNGWFVVFETPLFVNNRNYINKHLE